MLWQRAQFSAQSCAPPLPVFPSGSVGTGIVGVAAATDLSSAVARVPCKTAAINPLATSSAAPALGIVNAVSFIRITSESETHRGLQAQCIYVFLAFSWISS